MFDGYDDPILEIGASFDEEQKTMPTDKFAWFYKVSCSNMTRVELSPGPRSVTARAGRTGSCGCTRARATSRGWATSSPGTVTST